MAVGITNQIKVSTLFRPVGGTLASGFLSTDAYNASAQSFTNLQTYLWNSGAFNTQGQIWEALNAGDATVGRPR